MYLSLLHFRYIPSLFLSLYLLYVTLLPTVCHQVRVTEQQKREQGIKSLKIINKSVINHSNSFELWNCIASMYNLDEINAFAQSPDAPARIVYMEATAKLDSNYPFVHGRNKSHRCSIRHFRSPLSSADIERIESTEFSSYSSDKVHLSLLHRRN